MYKYRNLRPKIGIQFFAEAAGSEGSQGGTGAEGSDGSEGNEGDEGSDGGNGGSDKTFTQEEVTRMMTKEKRKGKSSLLRELGLNPDDKDAVKKLKALIDSQKTDGEKKDEAVRVAQETASKETTRANAAERKLAVLMANCRRDRVEEVTTLAEAKVSDDVTFDEALEEVKKKFPDWFSEDGSSDNGTGAGQGHRRQRQGVKAGTFGARLAQKNTTVKKNPYFNN